MQTTPSRIFSLVTGLTNSRFANTISNSLSNIKAHYDLSNGMFSAFLSKDMTYSCGIFKDLDGDLKRLGEVGEMNGGLGLIKFGGKGQKAKPKANGNHGTANSEEHTSASDIDELEEAQLAKLRYVWRVGPVQQMLCAVLMIQAHYQAGGYQARASRPRNWLWLGKLRHRGILFSIRLSSKPLISCRLSV